MRSLSASASGRPSNSTRPASGAKMFMIMRMIVLLPAPLGPSSPKISPG